MILLLSSAATEIFKQFILQVLCYPRDYVLPDVPFGLERVNRPFDDFPEQLAGKGAAIVLVDYAERNGKIRPIFLPVRTADIVKASRFAGKLLVNVRLGKYVHYDRRIKQGYEDENFALKAERKWSRVIEEEKDAPRAEPKGPAPIDPKDPASWKSGGKFVIEIADGALDFKVVDPPGESKVLAQCDDWKSVVDMVARRKQLQDKLFYQILELRRPGSEDDLPLVAIGGRSVYQVTAGDSADLRLHFYYGEEAREGAKRVLGITTESQYLATLGRTAIDVYPEQISGKIEQCRLIARKQLSQEFTRVTIQEKDAPVPSLAGAELYIQLQPRKAYIGAILTAFFLGSLLNALSADLKWSWVVNWLWAWKILGSGLMAGSFWLAFSKFPSKSG